MRQRHRFKRDRVTDHDLPARNNHRHMVAADPLPFDYAERLGSFEASVEHLTRIRPEAIDDYVILDDRDWPISLSAMPALLRAMGATRSA